MRACFVTRSASTLFSISFSRVWKFSSLNTFPEAMLRSVLRNLSLSDLSRLLSSSRALTSRILWLIMFLLCAAPILAPLRTFLIFSRNIVCSCLVTVLNRNFSISALSLFLSETASIKKLTKSISLSIGVSIRIDSLASSTASDSDIPTASPDGVATPEPGILLPSSALSASLEINSEGISSMTDSGNPELSASILLRKNSMKSLTTSN